MSISIRPGWLSACGAHMLALIMQPSRISLLVDLLLGGKPHTHIGSTTDLVLGVFAAFSGVSGKVRYNFGEAHFLPARAAGGRLPGVCRV